MAIVNSLTSTCSCVCIVARSREKSRSLSLTSFLARCRSLSLSLPGLTPLQQQDVNTLALSLDSHHPPLVPATTATTQPAHPAYAYSYSQPTLMGAHSTTTALAHQQPTVSSQPAPTQSVYTQPLLCQSSALMSTATQPLQSSVSVPAVDAQPWMSPASTHSTVTQPGLVHSLDAQTACTQPPLL